MNRRNVVEVIEVPKNIPGRSGKSQRRKRARQRRRQRTAGVRAIDRGFGRYQNLVNGNVEALVHQGTGRETLVSRQGQLMLGAQTAQKVGRRIANTAGISAEYAEIQGAIVAPQIVPPERYSTEYASEPTALANPWAILDYPWGSANNPQTTPPLVASDMMAMAFRDPLRNLIFFEENADQLQSYYNAFITPLHGASEEPLELVTSPPLIDEFDRDLFCAYWQSETDPALAEREPHGPVLYCGTDEHSERTYRWFDAEEIVSIHVLQSVSSAYGATFSLDKFQNDAVIEECVSGSASGTGTEFGIDLAIVSPGYYSPHFFNQMATPTTLTLSMHSLSTASSFNHRALPDLGKNIGSVGGVRIVGTSLMYTNNAAAIQKAGTVVGIQMPKEKDWQQFIGPLSLVSSLQNSKTLDIDQGIYGFLKPTEPKDLELIDVYATSEITGTVTASYFSLRNVKSYLMIRGTVLPVDGRSGFLTLANSLEYLTTDVWRPIDIAKTSPDVYKKALEQIKNVQQWHENPKHLKEIFQQVLSGATSLIKGVQKYAPQALSVAELLSSFLL